MAKDDALDLRTELLRVLDDSQVSVVTITLLSGEKYFIMKGDQVVVGASLVLILGKRSGYTFFPFHTLCNIDVRYK